MKLCLLCDLHLPTDRGALQYDVLAWAMGEIKKSRPDGVIYAGDVTCDGNEAVYDWFIGAMEALGIPFFYIPGNSDLRCADSRASVHQKASPCANRLGEMTVYAVNDSDKEISAEQLACLERATAQDVVFLHHPPAEHRGWAAEALAAWRERHPETVLFYGHLHLTRWELPSVSLQALDPDKAIGECPALTYYDTEERALSRVSYDAAMPKDFLDHLGISCYRTLEQIELATRWRLRYLELRPKCCQEDRRALCDAVARWREAGGEQLSIHLPDVGWKDGAFWVHEDHGRLLEIAAELGAERLTQHVPDVSVREVRRDPRILLRIADYLAHALQALPVTAVVGVENMHMTAKDHAGEDRRFGYIPEECLSFMKLLGERCQCKVGINLDIGHARNNAPYSQVYQVGTWLSMVGEHAVGYHVHQVLHENGKFENHMPILDVYGPLISYASFFKCWELGRIAKAPLILEMRPADAYERTVAAFEKYR